MKTVFIILCFLFFSLSTSAQSLLGYSYDKLYKHYESDNTVHKWHYNAKEKAVFYTTLNNKFLYLIQFNSSNIVVAVTVVSDKKNKPEAEKVFKAKYKTDKRYPGEYIDWENERRFSMKIKDDKLYVLYIGLYQDQL